PHGPLRPRAPPPPPTSASRNGPTELEADTDVATLAPRLRALGHETRSAEYTSGINAIVRTKDGWIGGADPRREESCAAIDAVPGTSTGSLPPAFTDDSKAEGGLMTSSIASFHDPKFCSTSD